MTTGKKYAQRAKDQSLPRLLDHRTRAVLSAIGTEPRGKALNAYLRTILPTTKLNGPSGSDREQ